MQLQTNPQLELATDFVQYTNQNIFLTGKAGTGKTTFLKNLKTFSPKRMVVVAPTGVAAINAGGVTIHSFFQISFGPQIPHDPNQPRKVEVAANGGVSAGIKRFSKEKINIIRSIDLLVIDEISMVRADLLDAIDEVLRRYRNRNLPFGGLQLLMIGDLQQLSPIVKDDEWSLLKGYYETAYFFSSRALKLAGFVPIELRQIFRQNDEAFINLLNRIRENNTDDFTLQQLNNRYIPDFESRDEEGYITLTTHNYQSQKINQSKLESLKTALYRFKANILDDFPEYMYPTDEMLELKVGAQVMFVKNDSSPLKLFYNGKIGKITSIENNRVVVKCPDDNHSIEVIPVEWQNAKYKLNEETQEIDEDVVGQFIQFPLKLAWAITIHKSQGLTFEKAIIDARQSFAHGQVYVALSRCKTLDGLVLRTPIETYSVKNDTTVIGFSKNVESNQPNREQLKASRKAYQMQLLNELFGFKHLYHQLTYSLKLLEEHRDSIVGNLYDHMKFMLIPIQTDMIAVAEKFSNQLKQLTFEMDNPEENKAFQERIQKAATYFLDKLNRSVEHPLSNASFETDNKATRKTISESFDKLMKEIEVKKACLQEVLNGFYLKKFLEVKAKATIEMPFRSIKNKTLSDDFAELKYPMFYHELRRWRTGKAAEMGVVIARILSQKTMLDIANTLPATRLEMKAIKGMGGVKLKSFGKEILALCINFRKMEGLEIPMGTEKELEKISLSTYEISLKLFKEGKTIRKIAIERQLATSTIESHLSRFLLSGELELEQLVEPDRIATIQKIFTENPNLTASEARLKLGDEYSYGEIRMVLMKSEK